MGKLTGISVVVVTLNEERNIGNLLECLLKQSHKEFEVIVVDSNSSDSTNKIVEDYKGKFKDFVTYQLGFAKGPSYGRNKGAEMAKHNEILFLDSDSLIDSNFLEELLKRKEKRKIDVAGICFKGKKGMKYSTRLGFVIVNNFMKSVQLFYPAAAGSCLSSKKEVHEKIGGFDVEIRVCEDYHYVMRASRVSRFRVLNLKHYFNDRRINQEGLMNLFSKYLRVNYSKIIKGEEVRDQKKVNYEFGHYK